MYVTENTFKVKQDKWKQTKFKVKRLSWSMSAAGCVLWNSAWCQNDSAAISQGSFLWVYEDKSSAKSSSHLPSHLSALEDIFLSSVFFLFKFFLAYDHSRGVFLDSLTQKHDKIKKKGLFRWRRRLGPTGLFTLNHLVAYIPINYTTLISEI